MIAESQKEKEIFEILEKYRNFFEKSYLDVAISNKGEFMLYCYEDEEKRDAVFSEFKTAEELERLIQQESALDMQIKFNVNRLSLHMINKGKLRRAPNDDWIFENVAMTLKHLLKDLNEFYDQMIEWDLQNLQLYFKEPSETETLQKIINSFQELQEKTNYCLPIISNGFDELQIYFNEKEKQ